DADFLAAGPFHVRYAHDWAMRRRPASPGAAMSRLYAAEGAFSPTGAAADHRLRVPPSRIADVAALLLAEVIREIALHAAGAPPAPAAAAAPRPAAATRGTAAAGGTAIERWVRSVARDLRLNAGRSIVIAGERQIAEVHAIA